MKMEPIQKQGFFIKCVEEIEIDKSVKHIFCGDHDTEGAYCHNCNKKLLRFLLINLNDEKLTIENTSFNFLPLFFCWTCDMAQDSFFYRIIDDKQVEILKFKQGDVFKNFPYPKYPKHFPLKEVHLMPLSDLEQEVMSKINANEIKPSEVRKIDINLSIPQHQIGGEPYFSQGDMDELYCPSCNNQMPFLATIGDKSWSEIGFVDNEYVQVVYYLCQKCAVVAALQQCD